MGQPNVLLVVLDSVRAKNTSLHNYPIKTTPNIDAFAEKATYYEQARAPGIHSIASHASIFSGYEVEEHKLFEHEAKLDDDASIWPELVEDYNYSTGLFTPNVVVSEASNLADHFQYTAGPKRLTHPETGLTLRDFEGEVSTKEFIKEAIRHEKPIRSLTNGLSYKLRNYNSQSHNPEAEQAEVYLSEFFNWNDRQDGPWAACINLMDAHYPYVAQPEFRLYDDKKLRSLLDYFEGAMSQQVLSDGSWWALATLEYLYDECIRQVDAAVKSLINELKRRNQYDNTLIVVTSDHGEAFGEYSQVSPSVRLCDHSWGIHEVQTHVPLVVKHPNQTEGKQIQKPASLVEFPNVIRQTLTNKETPSFVPESESVLSSTYRVPESDGLLPSNVEKSNYIGPWRAVYKECESGIVKQATHGDDGATIHINTAQESCVESRTYPTEVDEIFSTLTDARVNIGSKQTDSDVEEHLEALGYMR
ncbi:sulfatase-like hydrolase/transferase [Natronorubrum aibiense]|uniref:Sulfatase-like hydrolase/transferase n=1 Tax=Natronorubrum aibiense TaxID=348826 RepID=A0A5P9P2I8_9EURY|nr:sulfatase-like hydrolase/transferase [Natronorubrum aibiense]QFU82307.1 sulfatase-like hydrolase/transferase [Natronorubrum aibiense]